MRGVVLLAVVALLACSSGSTSPHTASPSPTMPPPASASPSAGTPSPASPARTGPPPAIPSPVVTVTSAGKNLACRLPITWDVDVYSNPGVEAVGFLTFPSGRVTVDHAVPFGWWFYDRAYSKWLPVLRQEVSSDGSRYAYAEGNPFVGGASGKVHVVDVATGADRVLYNGAPVDNVVDFNAGGIYLSGLAGGSAQGLWLENPAGGAPRLISRSISFPVIAGRAAFGLTFNSADPHPAPGGMEEPRNELTRLDLVTGASSELFYRPGADMSVLGVDQSDNLIVAVHTAAGLEEVWLITPSTTVRKLATFASSGPSYLAAIDRYGVWYTGGGAIWLYTGGAFRTVATGPVSLAGGCIP